MVMTGTELDNFIRGVLVGVREQFVPTPWRMAFLREQAKWENTEARNNPLACTQKMPGSTPFNSAGVQNYLSAGDGIMATIWTLDPGGHFTSYTDWYATVRKALQFEDIDRAGREQVANEIYNPANGGGWGTAGFAEEIRNGWNPPANPAPAPGPSLEDRVAALEAGLTKVVADLAQEVGDRARLNDVMVVRMNAFRAAVNHIFDPQNVP